MYFILIDKGDWQLKGTEQEAELEEASKHVSVQFWPNMVEYSFGLTFKLSGVSLPSAWVTETHELRVHIDHSVRYNINIASITRDFNKVQINRNNAPAYTYASLAPESNYENAKLLHAIIDVLVADGIIKVE